MIVFWLISFLTAAQDPPFQVFDLDLGERVTVSVADGTPVVLRLDSLEVVTDPIREAVRYARVWVLVDGARCSIACGNYELPVAAGRVQIDCPAVRDLLANSTQDHWGLRKAVRLRVWPARSDWLPPGTFVYPVKQRWFASMTQMANEPVYVDGGERSGARRIYYHSGLDIGGAEGMVEVVAAAGGLVVARGVEILPEHHIQGVMNPRSDVVGVLDSRGWYHRYSHLQSIDPGVKLGDQVRTGQTIGILGKEGNSGGWSHLHYEIKCRQPSGERGTQEGYAFLWEAYQRQYGSAVVAVARPHILARVGEEVSLDGSRSWSRQGIRSYEWFLSDGSRFEGISVNRAYARPGSYSEVLKVTSHDGSVAYDFAVVQVLDERKGEEVPPTIHATYAPTHDVRVGQPVTFLVRSFRTTHGDEEWDFGDGSRRVHVRSNGAAVPLAKDGYARTIHTFTKAGVYLVRVERRNERGEPAVAHLAVEAR